MTNINNISQYLRNCSLNHNGYSSNVSFRQDKAVHKDQFLNRLNKLTDDQKRNRKILLGVFVAGGVLIAALMASIFRKRSNFNKQLELFGKEYGSSNSDEFKKMIKNYKTAAKINVLKACNDRIKRIITRFKPENPSSDATNEKIASRTLEYYIHGSIINKDIIIKPPRLLDNQHIGPVTDKDWETLFADIDESCKEDPLKDRKSVV